MGFFRRFKLSDYNADECRKRMSELLRDIKYGPKLDKRDDDFVEAETIALIEEWACFRELLARHEGKNKSRLDK